MKTLKTYKKPSHRTKRFRADFYAVISLAIPTMGINVSRTLMQFVDFLFVTELGTEATAAVTPAGITAWVLIGLGMGTVALVNTFASQALGRGDRSEGSVYAWHGIYFGALFGALILPLLPFVEGLFSLFGHGERMSQLEAEYARIILLSMFPTIVAFGLQNYFIGIHKPRTALLAAVIANLFNIGADYVLIFGAWGIPAMGLGGAAWGTVLSTIVQAGILFAVFISPKMNLTYATRRAARWRTETFVMLMRYGLPSGVNWVADIMAWALFTNILVGRFGVEELAASNICFQYMHLSFMPAVGLGSALAAVVGKAIGERRYDRVTRRTHLGLFMCMSWMGLCGLVFAFFGGKLVGLVSDQPAVIAVGANIMICAAVFQVFDALSICCYNALRGAGDTFVPALIGGFCNWGVFMVGGFSMAYLFPEWGSIGPWSMGSLSLCLSGLAFYARFRMGAWRSIQLSAPKQESLGGEVVGASA